MTPPKGDNSGVPEFAIWAMVRCLNKDCDPLCSPAPKPAMNAHAPVLKWLVSPRDTARKADWEALDRQE